MGIKVLLSLDLERGVGDEARRKFYEYLAGQHWFKVPKVTTCWKATFQDGATEPGIVHAVKSDIANAASYARVSAYNAVVHMGYTEPVAL